MPRAILCAQRYVSRFTSGAGEAHVALTSASSAVSTAVAIERTGDDVRSLNHRPQPFEEEWQSTGGRSKRPKHGECRREALSHEWTLRIDFEKAHKKFLRFPKIISPK
jgi:hypothetical protein